MIDKELYKAEELDFYVETHQAGLAAELQPDLPLVEWCLADKLLGLSAITRPDVQFLANLENQIHETGRKLAETNVQKNNILSIWQPERSTGRKSLFPLPKRRRLLWLPLAASLAIALLFTILTASF